MKATKTSAMHTGEHFEEKLFLKIQGYIKKKYILYVLIKGLCIHVHTLSWHASLIITASSRNLGLVGSSRKGADHTAGLAIRLQD